MDERARTYRAVRPRLPLAGRTAVLVDDGIATGSTARAAIAVTRAADAARVVLAVPVAAPEAVVELGRHADEVVCPSQPERFTAVGYWYDRFDQVSDDEVLTLLGAAAAADHPRRVTAVRRAAQNRAAYSVEPSNAPTVSVVVAPRDQSVNHWERPDGSGRRRSSVK